MSKETLQKQNHNMGSVSFMEKFLFFDQVFVINTHVQKEKIKFWVDRTHQTLIFIVPHHHLTISKHNLTKKKPYTKKKEKKKRHLRNLWRGRFLESVPEREGLPSWNSHLCVASPSPMITGFKLLLLFSITVLVLPQISFYFICFVVSLDFSLNHTPLSNWCIVKY